MIGRRTGLALFLAVVTSLAAYGIVTAPETRPVAGVGRADEFVCSLPYDVGQFVATPVTSPPPLPARPSPGTVPDSFTPVSAVVCDSGLGPRVEGDGTATYFERHYSGDFTAAVDALNAPSARRSMFPAACGDYSLPVPVDMWLVDADGRAVEPAYPLSDCGFDNTLGLYEISKLEETSTVAHNIQIDAAGISSHYTCSSSLLVPAPGPLALNDLLLSPIGFCRFDTTGTTTVFLGAERYDETGPGLSEILRNLVPADPCTDRAPSVATTSSNELAFNGLPVEIVVELDGCRRILADGYRPLAAPDTLVAALSTEGW